jgi:hypothetical protein
MWGYNLHEVSGALTASVVHNCSVFPGRPAKRFATLAWKA